MFLGLKSLFILLGDEVIHNSREPQRKTAISSGMRKTIKYKIGYEKGA
jgi:hypothetical protein